MAKSFPVLHQASIDVFNRALDLAQDELEWRYETHKLTRGVDNEHDFIKMYIQHYFGVTDTAFLKLANESGQIETIELANQLCQELTTIFQDFYYLDTDQFEIFLKIHYTGNSTDIFGNLNSARSGLI